MDCSPPGSSVYGTFLAKILEWATISLSIIKLTLDKSGRKERRKDRMAGERKRE